MRLHTGLTQTHLHTETCDVTRNKYTLARKLQTIQKRNTQVSPLQSAMLAAVSRCAQPMPLISAKYVQTHRDGDERPPFTPLMNTPVVPGRLGHTYETRTYRKLHQAPRR